MTLDKFTIKAQEAVQEAVNTAQRGGQQSIEPIHLLKGVMEKGNDVVSFICMHNGRGIKENERREDYRRYHRLF